jgi:hypothetical protein
MSNENKTVVDVTNTTEVISLSQRILVEIASATDMPPKERVSAASALSRTALTQQRLKQEEASSEMRRKVANAVLEVLDNAELTFTPSLTNIVGRAAEFALELPKVIPVPGQLSTTQDDILMTDIFDEEDL